MYLSIHVIFVCMYCIYCIYVCVYSYLISLSSYLSYLCLYLFIISVCRSVCLSLCLSVSVSVSLSLSLSLSLPICLYLCFSLSLSLSLSLSIYPFPQMNRSLTTTAWSRAQAMVRHRRRQLRRVLSSLPLPWNSRQHTVIHHSPERSYTTALNSGIITHNMDHAISLESCLANGIIHRI